MEVALYPAATKELARRRKELARDRARAGDA